MHTLARTHTHTFKSDATPSLTAHISRCCRVLFGRLGIEFSDDQTGFQISDLWARRRQGEMANQVGAA